MLVLVVAHPSEAYMLMEVNIITSSIQILLPLLWAKLFDDLCLVLRVNVHSNFMFDVADHFASKFCMCGRGSMLVS